MCLLISLQNALVVFIPVLESDRHIYLFGLSATEKWETHNRNLVGNISYQVYTKGVLRGFLLATAFLGVFS